MTAVFGDFRGLTPDRKANLILTDPRYNIGHDYGPVDDNTTTEVYLQEMKDFAKWGNAKSADDASMMVIHYPGFFFDHGKEIFVEEGGWERRQQIRWCYSSNIGHSKRKWTTASREILWLTKGDPFFDPKADPEPYLNPKDKRVAALIEAGSVGRAAYDWWLFDLQKNVGADHAGYANQIPRPVLARAIACASQPGDLVVDPFGGTGSTRSVALEMNRDGWTCDLNPNAPCLGGQGLSWVPQNNQLPVGWAARGIKEAKK